MPEIELPDAHSDAIKLLADMGDNQFAEFARALREVKPFTDRKHLIAHVAGVAPAGEADDYSKIASTVVAMMSFCTYAEIPIRTFTEDVFGSTDVKNLLIGKDGERTRSRLSELLSTGSVIVAAKATANLTAHEHPFRSVRVFTDVRTVFIDDEDGGAVSPAAAVIVQMMRIRYIRNGAQEEIFFALDTVDIDNMINTLERAKSKQESLKEVLAKTALPCVEIAGHDEELA